MSVRNFMRRLEARRKPTKAESVSRRRVQIRLRQVRRLRAMDEADEAEEAKRLGIRRSHGAADPRWKDFAYDVGVQLAYLKPELTSQDIREHMPKGVVTTNYKAFAGVMRRLAGAGYIEKTDRTTQHGKLHNHNRPQNVWASLVCRGE